MKTLPIRDLRDEEFAQLPALIQLLEPELDHELILARASEMRSEGWRCAGCFEGRDAVAIAGYSQRCHFFAGRVLFVENVVVRPEYRGQGLGKALMAWLEALAAAQQCSKVTLDAYAVNHVARAFYESLGYDPRGIHFVRELQPHGA